MSLYKLCFLHCKSPNFSQKHILFVCLCKETKNQFSQHFCMIHCVQIFFFFVFRFSWLIKALFRRFCSVLSPPSIHSTRWSSPERVLNNQLAWFHQTTSLHWSSTGFERECCTTMFHLPFNHKLDCPFGSYIILVLELKSSWINLYLSFINCLFLLFVFS